MELAVKTRELLGRRVKSLRREGFIPAELYGHNFTNRHLSVPAGEFSKVFKEAGESVIINLLIDNEKIPVLIQEVIFNPINDAITHIDFYQINMDELITASVSLDFIGQSPAIKEKKGILVKSMHEIEVEALPVNLPSKIEVDISVVRDLGKSIYVKDLKVPSGAKFLVDESTVVATIAEPVKEEEVPVAPTSIEEIKVEGEEKKEKEKGEPQEGQKKEQQKGENKEKNKEKSENK